MKTHKLIALLVTACLLVPVGKLLADNAFSVVYEGSANKPGTGKHIVMLSGDDEYRSEECLPMLGKILAAKHGFKCTVLFTTDPGTGDINPENHTNVQGLAALGTADLAILFWRFREPSDSEMKHFVDYMHAGKPLIAIRTATHAFSYDKNKQSAYARYDWRSKEWAGGFGQQVLGDTWVNHHGAHGTESTRGIINRDHGNHPVLRGVTDIWGPTDVYGIIRLPADAKVLVHGQVIAGMKPGDAPKAGAQNNPMMPLIWTRDHRWENGKTSRIICTTLGSGPDFESEGLRRLVVNGCYWLAGLEGKMPPAADVSYVSEYKPTFFGFGKHKRGLKASDFSWKTPR
ncbi:MAG: ThuA domain-containing protein [Verrucomicrobia bacterium]|nr:ThuA domain-containing protein [Verrucomicrobiota bacterium]